MTKDPTYEELRQQIQDLEQENADLKKLEAEILLREAQYRTLVDSSPF